MRKSWDIRISRIGASVKAGAWLAAMAAFAAAGGGAAAHTESPPQAVQVALADVGQAAIMETIEKAKPGFVLARIDLSDQTMTVYVDEKLSHTFAVSTGRGSYRTPTGQWQAEWLSPRHRSRKYNNAPMPWSVFFYRGYAVHGTTEVKNLGRPASHGCVRLHPDNAEIFFKLVKETGMENTMITVVR